MKVLIYGSNGWIGSQFTQIMIKNNINLVEGLSRVNEKDQLLQEIQQNKPTHVISFIGRTHGKIGEKVFSTIDYLEEPGKLTDNVRDNLYSPLLLAHICKDLGIHYTYLGTGCIFEYDENHPYGKEMNGFTEQSLPNFFGSSYSIVKGFTDQLMDLYKETTLNLRIRMPITGTINPRNFITKISKYEQICNVPNSMTVLPELLPLVLDMMNNNFTGTINLTNPGLISHNEILQMYTELVDNTFTWKNFTIKEQDKILSSKRSNNYLDTTRLENFFPDIKNIKESIKDCLIKYKDTYNKI